MSGDDDRHDEHIGGGVVTGMQRTIDRQADVIRALQKRLASAGMDARIPSVINDGISPDSAWGKHGEDIATRAMRAVHNLQSADWINPDVDNADLSDACGIIADAFGAK